MFPIAAGVNAPPPRRFIASSLVKRWLQRWRKNIRTSQIQWTRSRGHILCFTCVVARCNKPRQFTGDGGDVDVDGDDVMVSLIDDEVVGSASASALALLGTSEVEEVLVAPLLSSDEAEDDEKDDASTRSGLWSLLRNLYPILGLFVDGLKGVLVGSTCD